LGKLSILSSFDLQWRAVSVEGDFMISYFFYTNDA
jgi:hypothetical protein